MEKDNLYKQMKTNILDISIKIRDQEKVSYIGMMVENMTEI